MEHHSISKEKKRKKGNYLQHIKSSSANKLPNAISKRSCTATSKLSTTTSQIRQWKASQGRYHVQHKIRSCIVSNITDCLLQYHKNQHENETSRLNHLSLLQHLEKVMQQLNSLVTTQRKS